MDDGRPDATATNDPPRQTTEIKELFQQRNAVRFARSDALGAVLIVGGLALRRRDPNRAADTTNAFPLSLIAAFAVSRARVLAPGN